MRHLRTIVSVVAVAAVIGGTAMAQTRAGKALLEDWV